jgi:hypothetical protein
LLISEKTILKPLLVFSGHCKLATHFELIGAGAGDSTKLRAQTQEKQF